MAHSDSAPPLLWRLGMEVAIDIGAKVATGEMKWG